MPSALSEEIPLDESAACGPDTTLHGNRARLTLIRPLCLVVVFSTMINSQAVSLKFDLRSGRSQSKPVTQSKPKGDSSLMARLPKDCAA